MKRFKTFDFIQSLGSNVLTNGLTQIVSPLALLAGLVWSA